MCIKLVIWKSQNQQSVTSNVAIAELHNGRSVNGDNKTEPHVTECRQNFYLTLWPKLHVHMDDAEMQWAGLL